MKKAIKISFIILGTIFFICAIIFTIYISSIMKQVKGVTFDKNKIIGATKQMFVYDNSGQLINEKSSLGSDIVKLKDLNESTINCFLAIEDKNFYQHHGLNYKRIAKATLNNIKSRSFREGASTISQQLIKNTHLTNEKTITRKVKEMLLTKKLENSFSKDEILETYLNVIYFGNSCYGIEQASKYYFDKSSADLKLEESAVLAGIIKAPALYSPINNYDNCIKRRNLVLREMYKDGKISDEEFYKLSQEPIVLNINETAIIPDPLYIDGVKEEAQSLLNLSPQEITLKGYKIYTYYDIKSETALEKSINNDNNYHVNESGKIADSLGIVINNFSGGIEAMYGKSDYCLLNVKRQPGSAIKPILVYAPALECGEIYNCSQILDDKIDYDGYSPNNVGNEFHGYVDIKESVAKSLNVPAVKIMSYLGIDKCKNFASQAGIKFNNYDNGYAIALGGFNEGVTLTDLVGSYIPFANNGNYIEPKFIKKITTFEGVVIYENDEYSKSIMGDDTAYLITDLLKEGVENGTSKRLNSLPFEVAGKTGTVAIKGTNLNSDVYSIAYTTDKVAGIWLGNYTFDKSYNLAGCNNGGTYCTSILKETFEGIYADHSPSDFSQPSSIVSLDIDEKNLMENHSVLLASDLCPDRYKSSEIFSIRHKPTRYSDIYSNFNIDFDVELNDNIATISIDNACDYLNYDIYVDNKLIDSISNKSGKISFEYDDLKPNKMYTFYVDAHCDYSDSVQKSVEKSVYTKNLYEKLVNDTPLDRQKQNNELSWYLY